MIALPLKTNRLDSAIAPLFGKAKWFAIVDHTGAVTFWRNEYQSGREVVRHFKTAGIDRVVFQDIGGNPYLMLSQAGIACYYAGSGRIVLGDALAALQQGALVQVTPANMGEYVEQPHRHSHGGEKEHAHSHEHDHTCGGHTHHAH